jgi:hypothetical protein
MDEGNRALTRALAVSFCGEYGLCTLHTGAVTGATRTIPECSALKTTPVVAAPRHDRVMGEETPPVSHCILEICDRCVRCYRLHLCIVPIELTRVRISDLLIVKHWVDKVLGQKPSLTIRKVLGVGKNK